MSAAASTVFHVDRLLAACWHLDLSAIKRDPTRHLKTSWGQIVFRKDRPAILRHVADISHKEIVGLVSVAEILHRKSLREG